MQFSLKWFLIAIAFVAVALVALLNASQLWREVFRSAAAIVLLVAFAGAIISVGESRVFWIGYVLFGVTYFVSATGLVAAMEKSGILPTAMFSYLHVKLYEPKVVNLTQTEAQGIIEGDVVSGQMPRQDGTIDVVLIRPSRATFVDVGNTVLCIPFGVLGGLVTTAFYRRRLRHAAQTAHPPSSRAVPEP